MRLCYVALCSYSFFENKKKYQAINKIKEIYLFTKSCTLVCFKTNSGTFFAKIWSYLSLHFYAQVWLCIQGFHYHRFQFYATIGGFSSGENCVSAAVNHTIYGVSTKLLLSVLQTCKGFCVFKLSVIVHNSYCVKCSLSYTADYTGTCP